MGFSMGSPATPLKISALPAPAHICFLGLENEHFLGNFRLKCQNGAETSEFQGFLTFGDLYEVPRTTPRSISSPSPRPHMFFENGLCIFLLKGPLCGRHRHKRFRQPHFKGNEPPRTPCSRSPQFKSNLLERCMERRSVNR